MGSIVLVADECFYQEVLDEASEPSLVILPNLLRALEPRWCRNGLVLHKSNSSCVEPRTSFNKYHTQLQIKEILFKIVLLLIVNN